MQLTVVLVVLVSVALVESAHGRGRRQASDWASTPSCRRYLLPAVSPSSVSYLGLSAKSDGNPVTGLKIWVCPTREATDIEENSEGRRLYFATDNVRGLSLPQGANAFVDCAFCPKKSPLIPLSRLGDTYTLPAPDASVDEFQIAVVAVEDGTAVNVSDATPGIAKVLNSWEQLLIPRNQLPSKSITLLASNRVAVFALVRDDWNFDVSQLSK